MESRWDSRSVRKKEAELHSTFLILRPFGRDPGFFNLRLCVGLFWLQGSTESNATNDEEEMKGRKGTWVFYSPFPVLIRSLSLSLSPIQPSVCIWLLWPTGVPRCKHVSLTLLTVCLWYVCVCVCVRRVCIYCVSGCVLCVCVLADSSALSQSSATEEMPPLLPSPQSSPASKFIHGNQKPYGCPWQGPNTPNQPPTHLPTPPPSPWLYVPAMTSYIFELPHYDPPSFLRVPTVLFCFLMFLISVCFWILDFLFSAKAQGTLQNLILIDTGVDLFKGWFRLITTWLLFFSFWHCSF